MTYQGTSKVTIEQDGNGLRVLAVAPPMWPLVGVGAATLGILGFLGWQIYQMVAFDLRKGRGIQVYSYIGVAVGLLMMLTVVHILVHKIRKQKAPRGVIIEGGKVTALTPDDTRPRHHFSLAEIAAAEMRSHATSENVDLVLRLRSGSRVAVIRQQPALDVMPAVDAVNGVIGSDRHFGFEVVLAGRTTLPPPLPNRPGPPTEAPAGEIEIDFDRPA